MRSAAIMGFYESIHGSYDDNQPGSNETLAQFIVEHCSGQHITALNIGCATRLPLELRIAHLTNNKNMVTRKALAGLKLVSMDFTLMKGGANVANMRATLSHRRAGITHKVGALAADMRRLPFVDNQFGLVVSNLAMDILPDNDRQATIAEAVRALKPGGMLRAHLHTTSIAADVALHHGFVLSHYYSSELQAADSFREAGLDVTHAEAIAYMNDPQQHSYYVVEGIKPLF